ncbi:transmembrane adaptor Erv26-domain-containing protein, partial [Lactifluus subvellereus]
HAVSYVAAVSAFMFVTLSLASGLLWISELIEEHSKLAKIFGKKGIYVIISIHVLLVFTDSLPFHKTLFSIFCHVVYLQNFSYLWPVISLTSPSFIASCILVVADHFMWFFHFTRLTHEARKAAHKAYRGGPVVKGPTFGDMATFFGLCVWLTPLFLFLSLSANDNTLPTSGSTENSPSVAYFPSSAQRPRSSLFRSMFGSVPGLRGPSPRSSEGLIGLTSPGLPSPSSPYALTFMTRSPTRSSYCDVPEPTSADHTSDFSSNRPPPRRTPPTSSSVLSPRTRGSGSDM